MSKLIPFWMHPAGWGLTGTDRQVAAAEYDLTGIELEQKIAQIKFSGKELERALIEIDYNHSKLDSYQRDFKLLAVDNLDADDLALQALALKHNRIDQYEYDTNIVNLTHKQGAKRDLEQINVDLRHNRINAYDADLLRAKLTDLTPEALAVEMIDIGYRHGKLTALDHAVKLAELQPEGVQRDLAILEARFAHKKITKHEYDKETATLNEKPWVDIVNSGFDPEKGISGVYFEFDWNEYWITYLRMNGYSGPTEATVVDMWFSDVCRAQGLDAQPGDGTPFM